MTDTTNNATPRKRKADALLSSARKKAVACIPCHTRKVKCSGGTPCSNCTRTRVAETCTYPVRNQKLTLTESELDRLVAERILAQQRQSHDEGSDLNEFAETGSASLIEEPSTLPAGPARNPLLDDSAWFEPFQVTQMPIHIGEASNSAFATRFRQTISASARHYPRSQYVSDSKILSLSNAECVWPPLAQARFLVKVAFRTSCSVYHCVRRGEILDGLEQHYRHRPVPGKYFTCKLLALFAIGEAYSTRTHTVLEDSFPGLNYFSRASRILRESNERPQIEVVECTMLLALFALLLNRRHSAYQLASSAVRQAIVIGLHQKIPESLSPDPAFREHCVRVWWTAYTIDRLISSKAGYPTSIQDDDISVDQPSSELQNEDFSDNAYLRASVRLASLSEKIVSSLYSRKKLHVPFAKRVQDILKELQDWVEELPRHLHVKTKPSSLPITWLHVLFNQHVILATRPVLIHVLRGLDSTNANAGEKTNELLEALAGACIRAARHSYRLLADSWIDGSFATFDHTYTQCLFSAATVLAISSRLTADVDDYDNFTVSCGWIQQLSQNGNFAASEFSQHLSALQNEMASPTDQNSADRDLRSGTLTGPVTSSRLEETPTWSLNSQPMTTEMALAEPYLQSFLSQTDLDLYLNAQVYGTEMQSFYP